MKKIALVLGLVGLVWLPAVAHATPQPLPFSYVYETLPKGSIEVETYADYTPLRATSSSTGNLTYYGASQFQTEFEYGITDRLELGLYVTWVPTPSGVAPDSVSRLTEGNGLKERLRLRLAEPGQWPLDVGLYGEVVENDVEIELEGKILLQRRIGDLRLVANLWGELEYNLDAPNGVLGTHDWVINPTVGATYQVTPQFHPGIEGWLRAEYPIPSPLTRTFSLGPAAYIGPTCMFDFGNFWFSSGVYLRGTNFGRSPQPGDTYGSVWGRLIVGLSF
ncbi:MAG TPA: hypothetical protein VK841_09920 [Polyangiaceae bacterium]|nr:hypothetical protein [Polyangiaceae bacterium]